MKNIDIDKNNDCASTYVQLYQTIVTMAKNEMNLIWMRYSAFIVLQGFILNVMKPGIKGMKVQNDKYFLALCIIGIIISAIWFILNHVGWMNQNIYLVMAGKKNMKFTNLKCHLPTERWENYSAIKPWGAIYIFAQFVPFLFFVIYTFVLFELGGGDHWGWLIWVVPISTLTFTFIFTSYHAYKIRQLLEVQDDSRIGRVGVFFADIESKMKNKSKNAK